MSKPLTVAEVFGDAEADRNERNIERIAVLLLSVPGWSQNYTASLDAAKWMLGTAKLVGWNVVIADKLR